MVKAWSAGSNALPARAGIMTPVLGYPLTHCLQHSLSPVVPPLLINKILPRKWCVYVYVCRYYAFCMHAQHCQWKRVSSLSV